MGLGFPEEFAEGPTIGLPNAVIKFNVVSFFGILNAAVFKPPVTVLDKLPSFIFNTIVNEPGQNFSIIFSTSLLNDGTNLFTISNDDTVTIKGLSDGLPLAKYIFFAATSFKPSPPNPYTVSVGNATKPPSFIHCPALFKASSSIEFIFINSVSMPIPPCQYLHNP